MQLYHVTIITAIIATMNSFNFSSDDDDDTASLFERRRPLKKRSVLAAAAREVISVMSSSSSSDEDYSCSSDDEIATLKASPDDTNSSLLDTQGGATQLSQLTATTETSPGFFTTQLCTQPKKKMPPREKTFAGYCDSSSKRKSAAGPTDSLATHSAAPAALGLLKLSKAPTPDHVEDQKRATAKSAIAAAAAASKDKITSATMKKDLAVSKSSHCSEILEPSSKQALLNSKQTSSKQTKTKEKPAKVSLEPTNITEVVVASKPSSSVSSIAIKPSTGSPKKRDNLSSSSSTQKKKKSKPQDDDAPVKTSTTTTAVTEIRIQASTATAAPTTTGASVPNESSVDCSKHRVEAVAKWQQIAPPDNKKAATNAQPEPFTTKGAVHSSVLTTKITTGTMTEKISNQAPAPNTCDKKAASKRKPSAAEDTVAAQERAAPSSLNGGKGAKTVDKVPANDTQEAASQPTKTKPTRGATTKAAHSKEKVTATKANRTKVTTKNANSKETAKSATSNPTIAAAYVKSTNQHEDSLTKTTAMITAAAAGKNSSGDDAKPSDTEKPRTSRPPAKPSGEQTASSATTKASAVAATTTETTTTTTTTTEPPKKKKKKMNFQEQVMYHMLCAFKPFTLKTLADELKTTETALNYVMLSLLDKGLVLKKDFTSAKGRVKTLYWANHDCKAKEVNVVAVAATAQERDAAKQEMKELRAKEASLKSILAQVMEGPSNQELTEKLEREEALLRQVLQRLDEVKARVRAAAGSNKPSNDVATQQRPKPFGGNGGPLKSAALLARERCPHRLKLRINHMRGEWKKRREKCVDFLEQLADGMEKKSKEVVKILDLDTDEMNGAVMPPKYDVA